MSNRDLLKQARLGITRQVAENAETVSVPRYPLVDDGFGGLVENPYGTPVPTQRRVRVSKQRVTPEGAQPAPAGLSTAGSYFVLADYKNELRTGDVLASHGKQYRAVAVNQIEQFGGIVGYESPLQDANG